MFTARPPKTNANGNGKNGNGNGHSNGNGNGHGNGNGNGHGNGNGNKLETVLGPGIFFKGTLTGSGGVRIEGTFDGTLTVKGAVVVADGAKVTADIHAAAVSVAGSVKGNITATKVEILSTGRVWGDLITVGFATEEGSFLRGEIKMQEEAPAIPEAEPVPALEAAQPVEPAAEAKVESKVEAQAEAKA
ncbi:MAG TPA: polymer-forming cytoskeletal protein [Anaerolineales bacterium]|nr:polymer-forming cytoskeletal protein [Anaerolineales bacterium]